MHRYGSFCPVAKASEILSERWTLLVLRNICLGGARRFNDILGGAPKMSPTLLAKRLRMLRDQGVIELRPAATGRGWEYHPTKAGEDLMPLIELVGHWGQRWVRSKLIHSELDPAELMWYIRHVKHDHLPLGRTLIEVAFTDVRRLKRWWILIDNGAVELCIDHPGFEVDILITTSIRRLAQIYIGDISLSRAIAQGKIEVEGPRELIDGMPNWFARSKFADDNPMSPD
jgi:DNA-binding HxlR family transcriptional regulator